MHNDERHELKQNDLEEFITHFGGFWTKWGNTILIVLTITVVGFVGTRFYSNNQYKQAEYAWADLAQTTHPDSYRAMAQELTDPAARSLCYLRGGDGFLAQANDRETSVSTPADPTTDTAEASLDQAATMYQKALDESDHPLYQLNGLMGLATVAETRHDFDQAQAYYQQMMGLAQENYPRMAVIAAARIEQLPRLETPVPFAPEPANPAGPSVEDLLNQAPPLPTPGSTPGSTPGPTPGSGAEAETTPPNPEPAATPAP